MAACLRAGRRRLQPTVDCVAMARPVRRRAGRRPAPGAARRSSPSRIVLVEHHTAHAASAYYASPFEEATVLTLDRAGDFRCGARWHASGNAICNSSRSIYYPDSLGELYGRVTELLGFEPAPTSTRCSGCRLPATTASPRCSCDILSMGGERGPRLDRTFFDAERLEPRRVQRALLPAAGAGGRRRRSREAQAGASPPGCSAPSKRRCSRWPASGENLCLAGGLALNALLVAALERSGTWKNVFVQPAAGNAGTALGAVLYAWHTVYRQTRAVPAWATSAWARASRPKRSSRCSRTASCASAIC